jgi:hypothetical protein
MGKKSQDQAAANLQAMRDEHWTGDRMEEMQFGEQSEQSKKDTGDLGGFLVRDCKTAQDVAAVIKKAPQHTRQIYLAAVERLGMQVAKEGVALAQSPDASVTVDNRGLLNTTKEDSFGERTAPNPNDKLPWMGKEAWDGFTINQRLGQHDLIAGTDSDGARCGFANALAVKVLDGPVVTAKWLESFIKIYSREKMTDRQAAAKDVISAVFGAIKGGTATYGDLSWLQEALHDWAFSNEQKGVGDTKVMAAGMDHEKIDPPLTSASAAELVKHCKENLGTDERLFYEWQIFDNDGLGVGKHFVVIMNTNGGNYIYDSEAPTKPRENSSHMTPLDKTSAKKFFPNNMCRMMSETKVRGANAKQVEDKAKALK